MNNQFHVEIKPIQRSAGRSSTAAAAYRAGEVLIDERTGEVHDYSKKTGVLHAQIFLPGGGTADRSEFWNQVEKHHRRKDAVVAREIVIALPAELTRQQRHDLATAYAQELADRYGVGVDLALHDARTVTAHDLEIHPDQFTLEDEDGRLHNGNFHAHILMTGCHCEPDGTLGKKAVELDPISVQRANKKRPDDDQLLNAAQIERPRYNELVNAALEQANSQTRWDHRSHAERELELVPTVKLGPVNTAQERRGQRTEKGDLNREITALNSELIEVQKQIHQVNQNRHRSWRLLEDPVQVQVIAQDRGLQPDDLIRQHVQRIRRDLRTAREQLANHTPDKNKHIMHAERRHGVVKLRDQMQQSSQQLAQLDQQYERLGWFRKHLTPTGWKLADQYNEKLEQHQTLSERFSAVFNQTRPEILREAENASHEEQEAVQERLAQVSEELDDLERYQATRPDLFPPEPEPTPDPVQPKRPQEPTPDQEPDQGPRFNGPSL